MLKHANAWYNYYSTSRALRNLTEEDERDTVHSVKKEFIDRIVYVDRVTPGIASANSSEKPRAVVLNENSSITPSLSEMQLENGGSSALNDETVLLVENFSFSGSPN